MSTRASDIAGLPTDIVHVFHIGIHVFSGDVTATERFNMTSESPKQGLAFHACITDNDSLTTTRGQAQ